MGFNSAFKGLILYKLLFNSLQNAGLGALYRRKWISGTYTVNLKLLRHGQ
jgi:hypothetical protein